MSHFEANARKHVEIGLAGRIGDAVDAMRAKKDFSQRQLELPKKVGITCRQCNEHDKFEKKEERRKSLDEAKNAHKKNAEIHNKGRQVHQTFHSVTA